MIKKKQNPRYANDNHTKISYQAIYVDEETGEEKRRARVEVNNDDQLFYDILNEFGDDTLVENKNKFLHKIAEKRDQEERHSLRKGDYALFEYKTQLFDYEYIHNTKNRKMRRAIRKAQTIEEARLIATVLLMSEVFELEPKEADVMSLLKKVSTDE